MRIIIPRMATKKSQSTPSREVSPSPSKPSADPTPILFGGVPITPSQEVFAKARANNLPWYQVFEQAYAQLAQRPENTGLYADPKGNGATIEQIWRLFTLFEVETYCILAQSLPDDHLSGIKRLVKCTRGELIQKLQRIQELEGQINVTTLHHDGTTGHCIRLTAYDKMRDRFIYHDPWPEKSLLCKENNMAGVDAQPEGERWSVTAQELERVLFASFIFPHQQARLNGVDFDLNYEQWKESDFFKFFHLKQSNERSENGMHRRMFTAGPFKDSVSVIVDSKEAGKITKACLILNKDWIVQNFPLALDISKSFIRAFAPLPDKATYDEISKTLGNLKDRKFIEAMQQKNADESTVIRCIHAFAGAVERASVTTDLASLSFENITHGKENIQEMVFTLV